MKPLLVYLNTAVQTVANTNTKTVLDGKYQLPQSSYDNGVYLDGSHCEVLGRGYFSTKASAPGTLQITCEVAGVTVLDSGALAVTGGVVNSGFQFLGDINFVTTDNAGTVIATGRFDWSGGYIPMFTTSTGIISVGNLATATKDITLTVTWSVADTGNTLTMVTTRIMRMN